MRKTEVGALPNSPLLMMAILIVMAIAVVVVIAMTLKLNQEVRNLAEDVEIDRQNLAKLNHEVGKRLGAPRPRGQQRPSGAGVPQQGRPQAAAQQVVRTAGNPATTPAPANAEVVSPGSAVGMPAEAAQGYVPGSYRVPVRGAEGPSAAAASARETARAEAAQSPRAAQATPRQSTLANVGPSGELVRSVAPPWRTTPRLVPSAERTSRFLAARKRVLGLVKLGRNRVCALKQPQREKPLLKCHAPLAMQPLRRTALRARRRGQAVPRRRQRPVLRLMVRVRARERP